MTSSQPLNALIWISVKPVLKLSGPALAGYLLTKSDLLPPSGSRSVSQIVLNVTLPALLFSKIIPSFNSNNVGAIGVIVLTSLFYMVVSLTFGILVRKLFRVPKNFRWGIIAAAGWSNSGDLPTSVVATITLSKPFGGIVDSNLAIAYVAIFILVFYITMFPMQGSKLISRDYSHPYKDSSDDEEAEPETIEGNSSNWWTTRNDSIRMYTTPTSKVEEIQEKFNIRRTRSHSIPASSGSSQRPPFADFIPLDRIITNRSIGAASIRELAGSAVAGTFEDTSERRGLSIQQGRKKEKQGYSEKLKTIVGSRAGSRTNSVHEFTGYNSEGTSCPSPILSTVSLSELQQLPSTSIIPSKSRIIFNNTTQFLLSLATPPTIALVTALVCALVKNLKVLFIYDPTSDFNPVAPDSLPPLGIILDTASFVGAASVPLGLMVLGSAIARMRLPRPWSKLPLGSIFGLAIAKLIFLPVIGYFFVEALTNHTNLVDRDNKVLRFTLIYFSTLPTATTQVTLTQIFAPTIGPDNSDVLASYLIIQYIIFVFSSVIVTAVAIHTIF